MAGQVHVELVGRFQLVGPSGTLTSADLPGRQGRVVVASLALADGPVPRDVLADRVWSHVLPQRWGKDLATVISKCRVLLAGIDARVRIDTTPGGYQLVLPQGSTVDVHQVMASLNGAERMLAAGRARQAVAAAASVARIARRPLLPDIEGAWLDVARDELRRQLVAGLDVLAQGRLQVGDRAGALAAAEEAIEIEPFREAGYRTLMWLHLETGERAAALQAYERCRTLLADELGIDPSPETEQLYLTALGAATEAPPDRVETPAGLPEIRYVRSGDVHIAHATLGNGPPDVVLIPGWVWSMESLIELPAVQEYVVGLSALGRLIMFDKRGTGLSDRVRTIPDIAQRADDLRAVLDAVGSTRALVVGISEGGALALTFAATYPERVTGVVAYAAHPRMTIGDDYPWGYTTERMTRVSRYVETRWGEGETVLAVDPVASKEPEFRRFARRVERRGAAPGAARDLLRMNASYDIRPVLHVVSVPVLVLHHRGDPESDVEHGRYLAAHVPHGRYVELAGDYHLPLAADAGSARRRVLDEVRKFAAELDPT